MIVTSLCDSGLYQYRPLLQGAAKSADRSLHRVAQIREIAFQRQLAHLRGLVFISILFDKSIIVPEGWAITCLPLLKIAGEIWSAYRQLGKDEFGLRQRVTQHYQTTEFPVRVGYFDSPSNEGSADSGRYTASGENKEAFLQMYLRRLHPSATTFYGVDPLDSRSLPHEASENRASLWSDLDRFLRENPPAHSGIRSAAVDVALEERTTGIAFQNRMMQILEGDDEYVRGIEALAALDRVFPTAARCALANRRTEEARDMARIFELVDRMDLANYGFGREVKRIVAKLMSDRPNMRDREQLRTRYLAGEGEDVVELLVDLGRIAVHSNNFVGAGVPVTIWEPYPHQDASAAQFILKMSDTFAQSVTSNAAGVRDGQPLRVIANGFDKAVAVDRNSENVTASWIEFWERAWALRLSAPWVALKQRLETKFGEDGVLRRAELWEELFEVLATMNDVVWINREGFSDEPDASAFFSVQLRRPVRIFEGVTGLSQDLVGSLLESTVKIFFPMSVLVRALPISRQNRTKLLRWYGSRRLEALSGAFDLHHGMNAQSVTVSKRLENSGA